MPNQRDEQAQYDANPARAKAMHVELQELAAELNIPLVHGATVQETNVTTILRVIRYIVRSTFHKVWEKQGIKKVMRVV